MDIEHSSTQSRRDSITAFVLSEQSVYGHFKYWPNDLEKIHFTFVPNSKYVHSSFRDDICTYIYTFAERLNLLNIGKFIVSHTHKIITLDAHICPLNPFFSLVDENHDETEITDKHIQLITRRIMQLYEYRAKIETYIVDDECIIPEH